MNILSPVNCIDDIPVLCEHGANELYIGFYDASWQHEFGRYSGLNRMSSFGFAANAYTLDQLHNAIYVAHQHNVEIFVTLNAENYTLNMEKKLSSYLDHLNDMAVDGIIVSGLRMVRLVVESGIQAIASTMCGIYNADIANCYIQEGVKRIILPRDLSLDEMNNICLCAPDAEYEAFLMRNGCKFADSYCLGFHLDEHGALCQNIRRSDRSIHSKSLSFSERQQALLNETVYNSLFSSSEACGLCALYRLTQMGISACKIVGRAEKTEKILSNIDLVRTNLSIASHCSSEKEYLTQMVFPNNKDKICFLGNNCYYPEIRFI